MRAIYARTDVHESTSYEGPNAKIRLRFRVRQTRPRQLASSDVDRTALPGSLRFIWFSIAPRHREPLRAHVLYRADTTTIREYSEYFSHVYRVCVVIFTAPIVHSKELKHLRIRNITRTSVPRDDDLPPFAIKKEAKLTPRASTRCTPLSARGRASSP